MEERKASDILLELEAKIDKLAGESVLTNFNLKLLLGRIDSLVNIKTQSIIEAPKPEETVFFEVPKESIQSKKISKSSEKDVVVKQTVRYPDGKPVILANVRILDLNNKELKSRKTLTSGSWDLLLKPGEYQLHIVKEAVLGKPQIDRLTKLIVPDDLPDDKKALVLPESKE